MSKKPYAIVKAEVELNNMIDQAKTPGADLWEVEQAKRNFLVSLQEDLQREVQKEVQSQIANLKIETVVSQEVPSPSYRPPSGGAKSVSYERIERYNTLQDDGGPGWTRFANNMRNVPYALFMGAVFAFAIGGLLHAIFPVVR